MDHDERQAIRTSFDDVVNMRPSELERWLASEAAQEVAGDDPGDDCIGPTAGRRVVEMQRKQPADLTDEDYEHMQKVVAHVRSQLAQRPSGDVSHTRWRYALMNWGHDPTRGRRPREPRSARPPTRGA